MADIFQIVENNGTPKDIGDSKARANIGEPFSVSKNYAIGDECLYEGILYKFTSNHNAGSWNSGHVTSINLADDKVNRSGDTMTSSLQLNGGKFKNQSLTIDDNISPSSGQWFAPLEWYDKNGNLIGHIELYQNTSNDLTLNIGFRRYINNTWTWKQFMYTCSKTGVVTWSFGDASAARTALELGDSGWNSLTDSTVYSGTIYYRKIGKLVEIASETINLKSAISANGERKLNSLPSGYRPSKTVYFKGGNRGSDELITVDSSSGDIKIYADGNGIATTKNLYFHTMYFTN